MYVQTQNLRCSCKHRRCTATLQTVFGSWVSHCIRISLRDASGVLLPQRQPSEVAAVVFAEQRSKR